MEQLIHIAILLLHIIPRGVQGAKILAIVPSPSYSHQIVYRPIWKHLLQSGHEVVLVTTDPIKNESFVNLTQIDVGFSYNIRKAMVQDLLKSDVSSLELYGRFVRYQAELFESQIRHEYLANLLEDGGSFDLVISEYLHPIYSYFRYKLNCPYIGLMSVELPVETEAALGNPLHPAVYSTMFQPYYKRLSFSERLSNLYYHFVQAKYQRYLLSSMVGGIVEKHFGQGYPSFSQQEAEVDLVLVGTNPAFTIPKPQLPSVVEFGGGVHMEAPKPLPEEINKFLNGADVAIYFSLGSNVLSKHLPPEATQKIASAFLALPHRVLWKVDDVEASNVTENIMYVSWAPQQDVLRHPNIKVFVTQCGYQSMEEALYTHVPLLAMPFFGDQFYNARIVEELGLGVSIDKETFTQESLTDAIQEVLRNPSYRERQVTLARLSKDQPISGIGKAIWWIEHILRHKGGAHLRCPVADLPLYQYYMLDTLGCSLLVAFLFVCIVIKIAQVTCCRSKGKYKRE